MTDCYIILYYSFFVAYLRVFLDKKINHVVGRYGLIVRETSNHPPETKKKTSHIYHASTTHDIAFNNGLVHTRKWAVKGPENNVRSFNWYEIRPTRSKKKHKKINIHVEATTKIKVSGLVQAYVCGGLIYRSEVTYYPYNIGTTLSFKDSVMTHTR